jgi:hypothetical protein
VGGLVHQVVDAMRQTVTNMLGTLPPQFFDVSVATIGENLAQLMYSVMMTGYMFRNAQVTPFDRLRVRTPLGPNMGVRTPVDRKLWVRTRVLFLANLAALRLGSVTDRCHGVCVWMMLSTVPYRATHRYGHPAQRHVRHAFNRAGNADH